MKRRSQATDSLLPKGHHCRTCSWSMTHPDNDDSISGLSSLSATSIIRRKKLRDQKKKRRSSVSVDTEIVSPSRGEQTLAGHVIKELLNKANLLTKKSEPQGYEAEIQKFGAYLFTKLRRVAPVNLSMLCPPRSWNWALLWRNRLKGKQD